MSNIRRNTEDIEVFHIQGTVEKDEEDFVDKDFERDSKDGCFLLIVLIIGMAASIGCVGDDNGLGLLSLTGTYAIISLFAICLSRKAFWIIQAIYIVVFLLIIFL